MMTEKSRVRALRQRIDDLPNGIHRNHMQCTYACIDSMTRRLQNIHDGTASIEDTESLKATIRHDTEAVAYLMLSIYANVGGNPAMWMAAGSSAEDK